MRSKLSIPVFLILVFLTMACSEDDDSSFDRSVMLSNQAENIILPAYIDFSTKIDLLNISLRAFGQNLGTNELAAAKAAWADAKIAWKLCELFSFGPTTSLGLETSFDRWPTSSSSIERAIDNFEDTDTYFLTLGSNSKSLPAIEYLLSHSDESNVLQEFLGTQERIKYLIMLGEQLSSDIGELIEEWNSYKIIFVSNVGNDAASGTTLLANKMAFVLENIKKLKLSEPSGIGQTSGPNPERVESPFAEISIDLITWELREAKRVFNGDNGQGFDDYLDALNIKHVDGVPLSETINNQFDLAIERAGNYDTSLKRTIAATPASVQLLIDDIQRLIILVKVDMISQLGILLIFNDNDGD